METETANRQDLTRALSDTALYRDKTRYFETLEQFNRTEKKLKELNGKWEALSSELEEKEKQTVEGKTQTA